MIVLPGRIAREQLKAATDPVARAVLDSRQKALKLTGTCTLWAGRAPWAF